MYSNFNQACYHAHTRALNMSSIYDYFKREETSCLPAKPPPGSTLTQAEINQTNELVKKSIAKEGDELKRGKYTTYTSAERARIGRYAAENGTTRACRYFSQRWKRAVPEATVRRLKGEYLVQLNQQKGTGKRIESLPIKQKGRPLLVGAKLDKAIQDYLVSLRSAGGVVNTAILLAAAEGIISARCPGKLQKQGGDLCIGKDWAKSLMNRMGFVKRKGSNAGKVVVAEFQELKSNF